MQRGEGSKRWHKLLWVMTAKSALCRGRDDERLSEDERIISKPWNAKLSCTDTISRKSRNSSDCRAICYQDMSEQWESFTYRIVRVEKRKRTFSLIFFYIRVYCAKGNKYLISSVLRTSPRRCARIVQIVLWHATAEEQKCDRGNNFRKYHLQTITTAP